jgi:hypothetical protein
MSTIPAAATSPDHAAREATREAMRATLLAQGDLRPWLRLNPSFPGSRWVREGDPLAQVAACTETPVHLVPGRPSLAHEAALLRAHAKRDAGRHRFTQCFLIHLHPRQRAALSLGE